jgi:ABC-2 type transport system permease protein
MFPIYKREMRAYFSSPIGYIFMAVLLALSGGIFSLVNVWFLKSTDTTFYFISILCVFTVLIPLLTMKPFSEERKAKTEQILLTSPVSLFGIVFAKFAAAFTLFSATFIFSCAVNYLTLKAFAGKAPVLSQYVGNIIGVILIGAAFISIGIFMSSLTENQVISAVTTFGIILAMLLLRVLADYIGNTLLRSVVKWFSVLDRFAFFTSGILSIPAVIYFISLSGVFLFLTARVYEMRRWN